MFLVKNRFLHIKYIRTVESISSIECISQSDRGIERKKMCLIHFILFIVEWSNFRIMGVLQRLSLTYLVVSVLELLFTKHLPDALPQVMHGMVFFFFFPWTHLSLLLADTLHYSFCIFLGRSWRYW